MRKVTLVFLQKENEVLLAMKKRGFGAGKWNGVGGKCEGGETLTAAVVREAREEIGVILIEKDLKLVADIKFKFPEKPEWDQEVFAFITEIWKGVIIESEEMKPKWFPKEEIPYDEMWAADGKWIPHILEGKMIRAEIDFGNDGGLVERCEVREVEKL